MNTSPIIKTSLNFGLAFLASLFIGSAASAQDIDLCEGAVTHTKSVAIPLVARPPFKRYFKDPAFGTRTIRITDAAFGEVKKPAYSTMQAWNADESLLILYHTGGNNSGHYLYDGHTYEVIRELPVVPADLEEIFWSHSDPDIFYYTSKLGRELGKFYKYNVASQKRTLIKDFSNICNGSLPVAGNGVHQQSLDDDLFGFRCRDYSKGRSGEKKYLMFTYRISTDETIVAELGKGTQWHNWNAPVPAPSGKFLWQQGRTLALDLQTVLIEHDMGKASEHSNVGLTHDGQDAIFQVVFDPSPKGCDGDKHDGVGHLTVFNLETGSCRSVVGESKGYPYTTSSTHISARATKRPGWVAVSSIGYKSQKEIVKSGKKVPPLLSEIYLVNTDPDNEVVCRLAHHRSAGKGADNGGYRGYFGEPHVTISPSGTRLMYGSDWYDSGFVDTYIIELPAYLRARRQ